MIESLLKIPSISSFDPALDTSNMAVCETLATYLGDAGASVSLDPIPGRLGKVNLMAKFGSGPPGLALCGHTDTVPYDAARWATDPFDPVTQDEKLFGLGSSDMKGFLALCAAVLERCTPGRLQRSVIVLGSADEETGMDGARALMAAGQPLAPFAVVGEPTSLVPMRQHKGIFMERVRLQGRSGHSSNPALGHNAIDAMHDVLGALKQWRDALRETHRDDSFDVPYPTLNFGRLTGGDNPNRICADAQLDMDMRLTPGMTVADTRQALRRCVTDAVSAAGIDVQFDVLFEGVDPLATAPDSDVVTTCEQLSGHHAGCVNFGTEAPFFSQLGAQTVVMGPGDIDLAHQPNEFLDLRQLEPTCEILMALIDRYCAHPEGRAP